MKFKLSKFVGRDQLPEDAVAFARISRAFAPAPQQRTVEAKSLEQRRSREAAPLPRKAVTA